MIAIIDYDIGNVRSVQKAFEYLGYQAEITDDHHKILTAEGVILPGVGAFSDAMDSLKYKNLISPLNEVVEMQKPLLGICLGMQLLFERSYEGGSFDGLGYIPGDIVRFRNDLDLKIPHIGWNELEVDNTCELFKTTIMNDYFYFVHSYHLSCNDQEYATAWTNYGIKIPVATQKGNVFGTQFHPEKSGKSGLKILKQFGELTKSEKES
jgi:glutamine amidotransferase